MFASWYEGKNKKKNNNKVLGMSVSHFLIALWRQSTKTLPTVKACVCLNDVPYYGIGSVFDIANKNAVVGTENPST